MAMRNLHGPGTSCVTVLGSPCKKGFIVRNKTHIINIVTNVVPDLNFFSHFLAMLPNSCGF